MTTAGNIDPKFSALQSSRNAKLALPKGFEKFISIHTGETVAVTVTVIPVLTIERFLSRTRSVRPGARDSALSANLAWKIDTFSINARQWRAVVVWLVQNVSPLPWEVIRENVIATSSISNHLCYGERNHSYVSFAYFAIFPFFFLPLPPNDRRWTKVPTRNVAGIAGRLQEITLSK